MSMKKVVVTGLGALAPNGNSVDQFWSAIKSGTSGIAPITYFDTSGHKVSIAGELKDFNPEKNLDSKELRKLDPFSVYALVSSMEAVKSAKLDLQNLNCDRMGVIIGCGIGDGKNNVDWKIMKSISSCSKDTGYILNQKTDCCPKT